MSARNMVLHHGATFAIVTKVRIAGQWRVETLDSDTFCQTSTRRRFTAHDFASAVEAFVGLCHFEASSIPGGWMVGDTKY